MGKCKFCNEDAGFLKSEHKGCRQAHSSAVAEIESIVQATAIGAVPLVDAHSRIEALTLSGRISETRSIFIRGWSRAVSQALSDGLLDENEDMKLDEALAAFNISSDDVRMAWLQKCQARVIREIIEGRVPAKTGVEFSVPLILQKGETALWAWGAVEQFQERTKTTYSGSSQGVSIRIAKGVYYRVGAFKGSPITTSHLVSVGSGALVFTPKHLYWGGGNGKALRLPWSKVIAVHGFEDGITIHKDGANSKPMTFRIGSGQGWAAQNLAENLPRLDL